MRNGTAYVLDAIWTASLLLGPVAIAHAAARIASDAAAACVAAESTGACGSGSGGGDEYTILNPDTSTAASAAGDGTCLMSSAAAAALWPLVWAAAGASSAAGAARCLGLAGVLASERLFWRASPPARAAMAVMAAEGLRGAALWPPGAQSEMLGETLGDALASLNSDAAAGPGPPSGGSDDSGERKETATTSGGGPPYPILLPHMLRVAGDGPCWRGAAWAKLVVALGMQIMRERAYPEALVAEPGAQRPPARRVQSGARPRTPAEALAASLAAFDGRELPGGAVLLCQEAPLQVCMLIRRVLSSGPYVILSKWC